MKFIRKLFFLMAVTLCVWVGIYAYNRVTDGFSLHQMTSSLPVCPEFDIVLSPDEKAFFQQALDQPFYYLGKGCQFYAFASKDGRYVLKFLKHKHLRPYTWLSHLPLPRPLQEKAEQKIQRRALRVQRLFSSCKLAYEKMSEETGLLYIHLNRTPSLETSVTLIDKLGLKHTIQVDDYECVLQQKACRPQEVFAQLKAEEVPQKIEQLVELVYSRYHKGICDRDRSFVQNVAFSPDATHALFIDIGQFYEDETILSEETQKEDLRKRLGNLHHWMGRHFPEYVPIVEMQMGKYF